MSNCRHSQSLENFHPSKNMYENSPRIENGDNCSRKGAPTVITKCGCTIRLESCQETIRTISIFSSSPPTRTITRNLCRGKVALHHTSIDHSTRFSHKLYIYHALKNKLSTHSNFGSEPKLLHIAEEHMHLSVAKTDTKAVVNYTQFH